MWKLYAFLSAFFAALTAVFAKAGVRDVDSDLATAIRTTIILLLTWGIVIFGCHFSEVKDVSRNTWVFLIFSGLSTGLSWLFYFKAIQLGDVSRVAPIDKLSVVITILLAFLFLHEQPSLKVVIGAVLIVSGSIFMINSPLNFRSL
ncbi:MAG: EamA family transporter [Prevotella denticola]|uniref:EamA family transporter n=1 Tax=Prevotella denticola TaxID=28129 RepID=UPI001C5CC996|nr:EamA family transporter [Prevotella denticola]MBW4898426.1 EamA family transporter [Prevotella denticola]